jgi:hypothetical protein
VNIPPRGQISPLWVRGEVKNGPVTVQRPDLSWIVLLLEHFFTSYVEKASLGLVMLTLRPGRMSQSLNLQLLLLPLLYFVELFCLAEENIFYVKTTGVFVVL